MAKYNTVFSQWVDEFGGTEKLAYKLGLTSGAIYFWLSRMGTPKPATMQKIIKLSNGKLTFNDILESTMPKK